MSVKTKDASRRQVIVLGVLLAALAGLVLYQVLPAGEGSAQQAARAANTSADAGARRGASRGTPGTLEDVALGRLESAAWPEPLEGRRNPFTMAADPPPPSSASNAGPATAPADVVAGPIGPPPPPPVPPIALKFIGMVSGPGRVGRIAALSDGKFVYHGREGQIVEGRYRIVKIGEESIQIEHADGRGRQTIRLSGK